MSSGCSFAQNQPEKLKTPVPDMQNLALATWAIQIRYAPTSEMPKMAAGTEIWLPGPGGLSGIREYHDFPAFAGHE